MNTTLSTTPGRHDHPPEHLDQHHRPVRRVGLLDRLALHVGIALITWGRRPAAVPSREELQLRIQNQHDRSERERAMERVLLLSVMKR
jgi:tRNA A37 threonylcarbamoyladenosine biosynthesis protein TsaE